MPMSMSHSVSNSHAMPTSTVVKSGHAAVQISHYAFGPRQITVKATYGLWATAAERDAFRRVLSTCPS